MNPAIIRIADSADVQAIERLLRSYSLPDGGVRERLGTTLIALEGDSVVGTAAVELFADGALLRSVAVAPDRRSTGVGSTLVRGALDLASTRGVADVYLLTTTADAYFPRFGFARVDRESVPAGVRSSEEFTSACPASAIVMRLFGDDGPS